ncbi:MAG TPA: signal peptidase I [Dyella sp.]|uniref:signal peptidase I n=1 Tax=Dyella sp. TaxID=1869338 RepID=UPI002F953655
MRHLVGLLNRNKGFIAFMFCMFVFRSAVADWNTVPTGSMQPTIRIGDRILVDRAAYDIRVPFTHISLYRLGDPQRGDIVVLDSKEANERLVKRVIGVPGDRIALRGNRLYVNGRTARYSTIDVAGIRDDSTHPAHYAIERIGGASRVIRLSDELPSIASNFGPVTVPPGSYLLMGDNRDDSYDSRFLGFAPRGEILGRARYVAFSLDPSHHYLPREDRFGAPLDGLAQRAGQTGRQDL